MKTWSIWDVWDQTVGRAIGLSCKLSGAVIDTVIETVFPFTAYYNIAKALIDDGFNPPGYDDGADRLADVEAEHEVWEPDSTNSSSDPLAGSGASSPAVTDEPPPSSPAGEHPNDEILGRITSCSTCGQRYITRHTHTLWTCPFCLESSEDIYDPDNDGGYYFRKIWG